MDSEALINSERRNMINRLKVKMPDLETEVCESILEGCNWELSTVFMQFNIIDSPLTLETATAFNSANSSIDDDLRWQKVERVQKSVKSVGTAAASDNRNSPLSNHSRSSPAENMDVNSGYPTIKNWPHNKSHEELQSVLLREIRFENTKQLLLKLSSSENGKSGRSGKTLILMRGVPGSGKSSLAELLASMTYSGVALSADNYYTRRGQYFFNKDLLSVAHESVRTHCLKAMKSSSSPIVIDNTNTEVHEMLPYVKMAIQYEYEVEVVEPNTSWKWDLKTLLQKNTHNVPKYSIERMLERFDHSVTAKALVEISRKSITNTTCKEASRNDISSIPTSGSSVVHNLLDLVVEPKRNRRKRHRKGSGNENRTEVTETQLATIFTNLSVDANPVSNKIRVFNPRRAAVFPRNGNPTGTQRVETIASTAIDVNDEFKLAASKLLRLFPDLPESQLTDLLTKVGGDLYYCVDLLLEDGKYAMTGSLDENEEESSSEIRSLIPDTLPTRIQSDLSSYGAFGGEGVSTIEYNPHNGNGGEYKQLYPLLVDISHDSTPSSQEITPNSVSSIEDNGTSEVQDKHDIFLAVDGDDWFDITLPRSFVSSAVQTYSNPLGVDVEDIDPEYLNVRIPPKMAFKLFQFFSLNVMQKLSVNDTDDEDEVEAASITEAQISADAEFAVLLSEMEEATTGMPDLEQIMRLEMRLDENVSNRAKVARSGIRQTFAQKLTLQKFQSTFPKLPIHVIEDFYRTNDYKYDPTFKQIMAFHGDKFVESGLTEKFEGAERLIKDAVKQELETLTEFVGDNNEAKDDDEMTGQDWREKAYKHHRLRLEYQERAREVMRQNIPIEAVNHYAQMSQLHIEQMKEANARAAEWFINAFNRKNGNKPLLDLHCLTVREALDALNHHFRERLEQMKSNGVSKLVFMLITGRGKNSQGGVPRLTPNVREYLRRHQISFTEGIGQFFVRLDLRKNYDEFFNHRKQT